MKQYLLLWMDGKWKRRSNGSIRGWVSAVMRSPTSVNTSAHNFSAVKMSSFSLKNFPIYPSKVYKTSSLGLGGKKNVLISYMCWTKSKKTPKLTPEKSSQRKTEKRLWEEYSSCSLHTWKRGYGCSQENQDCLWLQYRFYIAPRKRELYLKLQRCLGELSAVGVILALWLVWLFRCRGHEETEGSKMQLSRDGWPTVRRVSSK